MHLMSQLGRFILVVCGAILLWKGELLQNRAYVLGLHTLGNSKSDFDHVEMLLVDAEAYEFAAQLNESINTKHSLDLYKSAWDADPSPFVGYKWGKALLGIQDWESVSRLWQQEINRIHVSNRICTELESFRKETDNKSIAETTVLLERLALDTHEANRCLLLGYIYQNQLNKVESFLSTLAFTELPSDEKTALFIQVSSLYQQNSQQEQAIEYLNKAVQISPDDYRLRNLIAGPLIFVGNNDEAIFHLKRSLDLYANNYDSLRLMGHAYERKRAYTDAQAYYLEALEARPDLEESYLNVARVYQLEGQLNLSIEQYWMSVERFPNSWQSKILLARTLVTQGNISAAQELYMQLLTHEDDKVVASARLELGQIKE